MEKRSNNKNKNIKTRDFLWETIKILENSKIIYEKIKENNKEVI